MLKSQILLRKEFYAKTNIVIYPGSKDWEPYALWLEKLKILQINRKLMKENKMLLDGIRKAIDTFG